MERDEAEDRRDVRAALQHRRTHRLARYEDGAGRRHELVALLAEPNLVLCDKVMRKPKEPIACVAVVATREADSVGAIVADYLRWAPLAERMGIREVSPADVAGKSSEGRDEPGERVRWDALRAGMSASCREALDERPRRGQEVAA